MSKVMIVEDDDSLREIYAIRLTAEGYTVVSANNGEEALAVAVSERPDLIVSDVMMPKISGFDMLDILRSTPETRNIRVIMMTALSSEDQRERGENLGADRYLVKSQVGIEDVVNVVHEVLGDRNPAGVINPGSAVETAASANVTSAQPTATTIPDAQPVMSSPAPATTPAAQPVAPVGPAAQPAMPVSPAIPSTPETPAMPTPGTVNTPATPQPPVPPMPGQTL